jgi:hypothetical protein
VQVSPMQMQAPRRSTPTAGDVSRTPPTQTTTQSVTTSPPSLASPGGLAAHMVSPPTSAGSGRRSIKSPLAARSVVHPSPTYQPKVHEDRLHQLQLQNLSALLTDDQLLTTPSPMKEREFNTLQSSLSNTSIGFEDPDGGELELGIKIELELEILHRVTFCYSY